ncbi:MAG: flippase-like domain-containing protein [Bdellovibrionales bacterium]|nr:flippase-like domain-containing protein [Bdellovibrionales bacterium]
MNRQVAITLSSLISVVILAYFAADMDWAAFTDAFARLDWRYGLMLFGFSTLLLFIRALRWRVLLPSDRSYDTMTLFQASVVGQFAIWVMPLRAGEFIRPWVLKKLDGVSYSAALASIVTERIFDLLAMLTFFGLVLLKLENTPALVKAGAGVLGTAAICGAAFMIAAYIFGERLSTWCSNILEKLLAKRFPQAVRSIEGIIDEFVRGVCAISSAKEFALAIMWSLVYWLFIALLYQCGLWAFGQFPTFWVGMTLNVFVAVAVALPSAPGFIGVFELGCVAALSGMYGYPEAFTLSYAVIMHGTQFLACVVLTLLVLRARGMALGQIFTEARTPSAPQPAV